MAPDTVPFGKDDLPPPEKTRRVQQIFRDVAPHYDLMNDVMSAGLHRVWKAAFLDRLPPEKNLRLLDVAGGTGDIALGRARRTGTAGKEITVCDPSAEMLHLGREKALNAGFAEGRQVQAPGEALPFEDMRFDLCTIAFGLRNTTDIHRTLREIHRVLRPGGRFLCLEFSPHPIALFKPLYDLYSFNVLPLAGKFIAGHEEAYRYLVESIRRFPAPPALAEMMRETGFKRVSLETLSAGIVVIHGGWRI